LAKSAHMKGVKNWKTKKESGIADFKVDTNEQEITNFLMAWIIGGPGWT